MINARTSAKRIMEVIENNMAEVSGVELHHKKTNESRSINPDEFVKELKLLSSLKLFNGIDFEYNVISSGNEINNEKIQIFCGHYDAYLPHCIDIIIKLNKSICNSIVVLFDSLKVISE